MRELRGLVVLLFTGVCLASSPAIGQPVEPAEQDPRELFFDALDLKDAGDWEGAIARFQLAMSGDPSMVQCLIHVAECFYELDMNEEAIVQAEIYLKSGFEMAEVNRAQDLIIRCRWELNNKPDDAEPGSAAHDNVSATGDVPVEAPIEQPPGDMQPPDVSSEVGPQPARPSAVGWAPVSIETGGAVEHFANTAGLTTGGPLVAVRILPWHYLELSVRAPLGLGGYQEGTVRVPAFGISVGGSIPFGRVRVGFGGQIPMVLSGYGGETRIDVGTAGEVGIRVALGDGRLTLGAQFGGGYLVRPFVGGSIRVGVQLGELQ